MSKAVRPIRTRPEDASFTRIIAFEQGELDARKTLRLFAQLVFSGLAWQLQGSYGRQANALLANGLIDAQGHVTPHGVILSSREHRR